MVKTYILGVTTLIASLSFVTLPASLMAGTNTTQYAASIQPALAEASSSVIETAAEVLSPTPQKETASSAMPAPSTNAEVRSAPAAGPEYPVTLVVPSIDMRNPVVFVGLNSKGEMDVPSGDTNHVGWYEYGTKPGEVGSAVLDAHVFAAFARLNELKPGQDIYVMTNKGRTLHYVVEEARTYLLADVPREKLFNRADTARLNLITCAGSLTPDRSTYDHRFIAYAVLAQ